MNTTIDLGQFGAIVGALVIIGAILKNAIPAFPNRFIPLLTLILGVAAYLSMSGGWNDPKQWVAAFMAAATATGTHSTVKNTFQSREENTTTEPSKP